MKFPGRAFLLSAWFAALFGAPGTAWAQQSCESLASLRIPDVTITLAAAINPPPAFEAPSTPGRFGTPPGLKVSVPFCRVAGFAAPSADSHISFEVWLPVAANWNGKYLALGNPGFIGSISYGGLVRTMVQGYATASTDTGHSDIGVGNEAPTSSWTDHPEKIKDWGYRAVHETTFAAKALVRAYYGRPARYAYWSSCHEGGNQGLTEAQRYPKDFDGIAAGDPAYYITHLQAISEYITWVSLKDGVKAPGYIPPSKYPVINRAALDVCDAQDGVRDGVIEDPERCHFDPRTIRCPGNEDLASCLTGPQVGTAKRIYAGAKFADGTEIYPGFDPGSELGWGLMAAGPEPLSISTGFFQNMVLHNPHWDFRTFDVDRDTRRADAELGAMVNSMDPNLKPFKNHGGKLILYQSWNEAIIPPRNAIAYYKNVLAAMGGARQTSGFFRVFMVPGMPMCPGFSDPKAFNPLAAVQQWREKNIAPDKIIATHTTDGKADRTHPVCPYPQAAIYKGSGDPNDAASFVCGIPKW